jgi:glycerate-2-kinase
MKRENAIDLIRKGMEASDPEGAVLENTSLEGSTLIVCGDHFYLDVYERIIVAGAGKASERMALGLEKILDGRISEGLVITKKKLGLTSVVEVVEGSHPLPDERSLAATEKMIDLLSKCTARDLIIFLVSGGGSSLLCYPEVSLESFRQVTDALMRSGADIKELNTVRKKLSMVKGGRLAAMTRGEMIALIMSDVVGDDVDLIASGPTASDTSTNPDAVRILEKYQIMNEEVSARLYAEGPAVESRAHNYLIATNRKALDVMRAEAEMRGYNALILSSLFEGEARQTGAFLAAIANGIQMSAPACILCGGEAVVRVRGKGRGGPNMEIAASFAMNLKNTKASLLCVASDGEDGSTYAAGAFADSTTASKADELGLSIREYLDNNDTLALFEKTGDLIVTGSTGTNVNSFWLLFIEE